MPTTAFPPIAIAKSLILSLTDIAYSDISKNEDDADEIGKIPRYLVILYPSNTGVVEIIKFFFISSFLCSNSSFSILLASSSAFLFSTSSTFFSAKINSFSVKSDSVRLTFCLTNS